MSELLREAETAARNDDRLGDWYCRYYARFGEFPNGDIRRHRRFCIVDDFRRLAIKELARHG